MAAEAEAEEDLNIAESPPSLMLPSSNMQGSPQGIFRTYGVAHASKCTTVSGTDSKGTMLTVHQGDQTFTRERSQDLKCCRYVPIGNAIRIIFIYEFYHIFTEY